MDSDWEDWARCMAPGAPTSPAVKRVVEDNASCCPDQEAARRNGGVVYITPPSLPHIPRGAINKGLHNRVCREYKIIRMAGGCCLKAHPSRLTPERMHYSAGTPDWLPLEVLLWRISPYQREIDAPEFVRATVVP